MTISRVTEVKLVLLAVLALVVIISCLTFDAGDMPFLTSSPNISKSNVVGSVGAYVAWSLFFLIGFGAYIVPVFILIWGAAYLFEGPQRKAGLRIFGTAVSIVAVSSVLSLLGSPETVYRFQKGGILGIAFSDFLLRYLGTVGTLIVIGAFFFLSLLITTDFILFTFVGWVVKSARGVMKRLLSQLSKFRKGERRVKEPPRQKSLPVSKTTEAVAAVRTEPSGKLAEPRFRKEPVARTKEAKKEPEKKEGVPRGPFTLPSLDLLATPPSDGEIEIKENLEENSKILEDTLNDFGIETKVVEVSKGPVITRYELEPASGVKIHKITSLSDNIALAMKAVSVRIIAPIPGKGTVGVEVPNQKGTLVYIRDILQSKEYTENPSRLKLALGKDISGAPIVAQMDDMPHLLIAGATGSGKTVCVNTIITSLLFNASPDEIKFLMVDPKRVELALFNGLPHLLAPVVTDPKKVSHALTWTVNEMERRYELFAQIGVRNIEGYNKKTKTEDLAILPYIVVIIDELADLMLVSQQEVENTITRLAQLSRAVGIHIIIATQRPSVDVITGVIKANFPARISFKVASKVDSRTVIDINGAEKLLGRGDMLFIDPSSSKPIRAQGSLVGDDEIKNIVTFIKSQRKPEFEEGILKGEEKTSYSTFEKDEIYEQAVRVVLQTKQASVSMLQRRLGVGYTRAARLIDMMEDEKIIGPYQGSKPRDILIESLDVNN
jgi:S-DNA-T family DNA segregation ATPase FtsK/SpoIIIE